MATSGQKISIIWDTGNKGKEPTPRAYAPVTPEGNKKTHQEKSVKGGPQGNKRINLHNEKMGKKNESAHTVKKGR